MQFIHSCQGGWQYLGDEALGDGNAKWQNAERFPCTSPCNSQFLCFSFAILHGLKKPLPKTHLCQEPDKDELDKELLDELVEPLGEPRDEIPEESCERSNWVWRGFFYLFVPGKCRSLNFSPSLFFSIYVLTKTSFVWKLPTVALNQRNFPFLPFIVLVVLGMGFRSLLHFGFLKNGSMFLDRQAFWMKGLRDCQRRR